MKNNFRKILVVLALAALVLSFTCAAMAEVCPAGTHTFMEVGRKEATCTVDGVQYNQCTVCGFTWEKKIEAGHKYQTTTVPANCTKDGQSYKQCAVCAQIDSGSITTVTALGHDMGEWYTVQAATCTTEGKEQRDCKRSDLSETRSVPAKGHNYTPMAETVPATCTTAGLRTSTCLNCGDTKTESVPAKGHTMGAWTADVAPTCTNPGRNKRVCSVCGYTEYQDLPALGHNFGEWSVAQAPTCEKDGYEHRLCGRCTLEETRTLKATGHAFGEWVTVKAPTCTEKGLQEKTCSKCGTKQQQEIPVLGHSYGPWTETKAPTCTQPGEKQRVCSRCGHIEKQSIPATGHSWGEWVVTKQPTYKEEGSRERTCKVCGEKQVQKMGCLYYYGNTMCAFGPREKDMPTYLYPHTTDNWYMVTPFDASQDGVQIFELVASNMYIVGELTIEVKDGYITVDYHLDSNRIDVTLEFFTIMNNLDEFAQRGQYEPEQLLQYRMKRLVPISIADDLNGDTNLVLYFCSRIDYQYDEAHMDPLNYDSIPHKQILNDMYELINTDNDING